MIGWLLLILSAGSTLAGFHVQMPYLHPAGVTYSGVAAASFPAQHLQYTTASSSVAYGNGGLIRSSLPAAIPYSAPVAIAHPLSHVVPTVHNIPAVAQVPVTNYESHPAIVQNFVDVAKAKLASSKIEVRRPAIQKEFFDVEERLIIRPVGSAVVELDEPVSKSQKEPTVVRSAIHAIPTIKQQPLVTSKGLHSHFLPAAYPSAVSVHPYPFQGPIVGNPVQYHPSYVHEIHQQPEELHQLETEQEGQAGSQGPEQFPQQQPEQIPQQQLDPIPQQVTEEEPQQEQQQQPQFIQQEQAEPQQFDDSDSVAIDNPEVATDVSQFQRSIANYPNLAQRTLPQGSLHFSQIQQRNLSNRQGLIAASQVQAQEEIVARLKAQTEVQQAQLQRAQQLLQLQQEELARSRSVAETFSRTSTVLSLPPSEQSNEQTVSQTRQQVSDSAPESPGSDAIVAQSASSSFRNSVVNDFVNVTRSASSFGDVVPSLKISPEQSQSNQERLIALLTGRGGVVETPSNGQASEVHQIRARVLSVTPAPEGVAPREEKINTRRIVVNRPIQTIEEVDVVQPFAKIERVAIQTPAVIKTARYGVAHVPTSLPVQSYSHAIPVAAIPSY